jgi:hypothetical protein
MYNKKYPCINTVIDDSKSKIPKINSRINSRINFKKLSENCFQCPKCHNTYRTKGNAKRHYYDICILNDNVHEVFDDVEIDNNGILNDGEHISDAISGGLATIPPIFLQQTEKSRDCVQPMCNMVPHAVESITDAILKPINDKDKSVTSYLDNHKHRISDTERYINDIDLDALKKISAHFGKSQNLSSNIGGNEKNIIKETNIAGGSIKLDSKIDELVNTTSNTCPFCDTSFTRKDNLDRHLADRCKLKLQIELSKKEAGGLSDQRLMAEMLIQMKEMQQKILELEGKNDTAITGNTIKAVTNSNSHNNSNSNNTIQTVNNDIKIIAFGKEDLYTLLDDEQAKKYLNHGYQSVYNLIEYMHFNPDKPELHSVYISNMFHPYAHQFDGERWQTVDKDEAIDQLFDDKACYLNAMFKELKNQLAKKTVDKYSRFMNDTDEKVIENIKNDIKKLLYNKRHIPLATKKKMGL